MHGMFLIALTKSVSTITIIIIIFHTLMLNTCKFCQNVILEGKKSPKPKSRREYPVQAYRSINHLPSSQNRYTSLPAIRQVYRIPCPPAFNEAAWRTRLSQLNRSLLQQDLLTLVLENVLLFTRVGIFNKKFTIQRQLNSIIFLQLHL